MGGDPVPTPLDALRDSWRPASARALEEVMAGIEAFKKNMEDLGLDVHVQTFPRLADVGPPIVLTLTAIIRKELEEEL